MPERRPFVRLPTDVYPVNYGLRLKPDLIDFTFEGKLEAAVEDNHSNYYRVNDCGRSCKQIEKMAEVNAGQM